MEEHSHNWLRCMNRDDFWKEKKQQQNEVNKQAKQKQNSRAAIWLFLFT